MKTEWLVEVTIEGGDDIRAPFETKEDAIHAIHEVFEQGFVSHDLAESPNKYDSAFYPIHRVLSIHLSEREVKE